MINISMNVIVQITSNSMNGTLTYNGTDYNISGSKIKINLGTTPVLLKLITEK